MKYAEYKEDKKHGSADFPLQYYFVDDSHPQYVMPLHWHREFEVLRVLEGSLSLYINNTQHTLTAGDVAVIPSGALHRGDPYVCTYDCAVFDFDMISGFKVGVIGDMIRQLSSSEIDLSVIGANERGIIYELLDTVSSQNDYYELKAAALVTELAHMLYSIGAVRQSSGEKERFVHRRAVMTLLIDKIEKEYTHKITLESLASIAQINEKYLCRFFKEFTGQTPIDYINRLRIDRACYEMSVNNLNVTEAVYECGFNELSYFSKIFKKYKGISPGVYRKKYCKKG